MPALRLTLATGAAVITSDLRGMRADNPDSGTSWTVLAPGEVLRPGESTRPKLTRWTFSRIGGGGKPAFKKANVLKFTFAALSLSASVLSAQWPASARIIAGPDILVSREPGVTHAELHVA